MHLLVFCNDIYQNARSNHQECWKIVNVECQFGQLTDMTDVVAIERQTSVSLVFQCFYCHEIGGFL
jgi:Cys-tRNA synthase (O-phospho-L-seryl-tRNA:Cys-tRNA synthase)